MKKPDARTSSASTAVGWYKPWNLKALLWTLLELAASFDTAIFWILRLLSTNYVKQKDQTNSFSIVHSQIDQFQESNLWSHANLRF
jgi:hypothetical protein